MTQLRVHANVKNRRSCKAYAVALLGIVLGQSAACAGALSLISYAEQNVQLIRGTSLYDAGAGIGLQAGDIVESRGAGVQIEGLAGATVALGADTKIFLVKAGIDTELRLLSGWMKVQPTARARNSTVSVDAGALRLDGGGTSVIHAGPGTIEIFVEQGEQSVSDIDPVTQANRHQTLGSQQYALRRAGQPVILAARPGKEFVAAMPRQFFDPLVPVASRLTTVTVPAKQRDVAYEDVSPWLVGIFGLDKKTWTTRFSSRLADPAFRKKLTEDPGRNPDWKLLLQQQESKKKVVQNTLF